MDNDYKKLLERFEKAVKFDETEIDFAKKDAALSEFVRLVTAIGKKFDENEEVTHE